MSRGSQTFRPRDVTKALKGVVAAGIEVQRVEVDRTGKIVVVTSKQDQNSQPINVEVNEWDRI
jgi:hypothetical protein